MNISKLSRLSLSLAMGAALTASAAHVVGTLPGSTDFESITISDTLFEGATESEIIEATSPGIARSPNYEYANTRAKVLSVDEDASAPLFRKVVDATGTPTSGTIYADLLVNASAVAASGFTPTPNSGDKLLIYFKETSPGVTNLCVYAGGYIDDSGWAPYDNYTVTPAEYVLTSSVTPSANNWCRLVVVAQDKANTNGAEGETWPGYQLYLGGYGDDYLCTGTYIDNEQAKVTTKFIPLTADGTTAGSMSKVGFAGAGLVDDFVVSTYAPGDPAAWVDSITLTWPSGYTPVSYTVDGGEAISLTGATSPCEIDLRNGAVVAFTFANADGIQKTLSGTVGTANTIAASSYTFGWADYLGATVDGAYQIDDANDLDNLRKGVAAGLATADTTFKLTANVTLDIAWPGIGVQNAKDLVNHKTGTAQSVIDADLAKFEAEAFRGTFDGQNYTISGFQMIGKGDNAEGLDYCGFFNSTYGATIQNLKIAYAGSLFAADTTADTKESGATFVGVSNGSTLSNLTTVAGTVSCSKGFGGIVGYTMAGTTVDSCTNNVNMTSLANNKCGGIAMITQGGSGSVTIRNCQNNGTQTSGSANSEYGAIVGYVGLNTTIADCETTVGRFLKHETATVTLQGVNKGDARVLAYHGAATPGLNFATVDGNVATFVADNALAAGNTYKVMGPSATATATLATESASISFDTALATPTYAITAGEGLVATSSTSGTVTTYTAATAKAMVITIADAGATTNTVGTYASLAAAIADAPAGSTVVLLANVNEAVVNSNANSFTIDLNGKTWSSDSDVLATSVGTITIEATNGGTMTTEAAQCCAVWAKGGNVVINGGTFTSKDNEEATIYVSNADSVVTINGGTFENTDTRPYRWKTSMHALTLNVKNDLVGRHLIINGGTFIGNDPQLGDDTAGGTSAQSSVKFVSDGFVAIDGGNGNWVVQPGYNVTFDANGGMPAPAAQRIAAGGKATAPATAPAKEGYLFSGWTLSGAAFDFDAVLDADITLVAAFDSAKATVMTIADAGATTNYTYYATVTAALEAAQTGETVVVLANTHERVYATVNNNVTLDINGATMTSPVDDVIVKNGSGTLTIVDTAATPGLVQSTINGVDLGVAVWARQGKVVVESGVFENNSNYEATLYVSTGAYAEVSGGTFRNVAEGTYNWKKDWTPINLNVQNGHADKANAITVSGGSFSTDPALGDDTLTGSDVFLASGYESVLTDGMYVVQEITSAPHTDDNGSDFTLEVSDLPPALQNVRPAAAKEDLDTAVPGKGYTYAEGIALGLVDVENGDLVTADLPAAEISFDSEGNPVVTFGEDGMGNASFNVVCKLFGKAALSDEWSAEAVATGAPGTTLTDDTDNGYHFYKVVVVITDKE